MLWLCVGLCFVECRGIMAVNSVTFILLCFSILLLQLCEVITFLYDVMVVYSIMLVVEGAVRFSYDIMLVYSVDGAVLLLYAILEFQYGVVTVVNSGAVMLLYDVMVVYIAVMVMDNVVLFLYGVVTFYIVVLLCF